MLCQECGNNPATLHFTKIVNGEKTEFHICEACAQEKGEWWSTGMGNFPISQFLSGLMHLDAPKVGKQSAQPVRCQTCGMTYQQFSKMGRFGCKDCYRFFGDHLDSLLRRVHGSAAHTGKVPNRAAGRIKVKREIEQLKQQLQRHIQREEFELAAQVRDRLRALENDWTDASSGGE